MEFIPGICTINLQKHFQLSDIIPHTLSKAKVLVTTKPQPSLNALRIIGAEVVGVALARPHGLGNLSPQISTLVSTRSMGVKNIGSFGVSGTLAL